VATSLRGRLLRMLLPPVAALLVLGALAAYFLSLEPATEAYDQALVDFAVALGGRLRTTDDQVSLDLPDAAEQVLRTDKYDAIFYSVRGPGGDTVAGDRDLPPVPPGQAPVENIVVYDGTYNDRDIRVVALLVPCGGGKTCTVKVAETTVKRSRLARNIVLSSLVPGLLVAMLTLAIVWFGVKRGLAPLEDLSEDIRARSARDLRAIDPGDAPQEAKPLVGALNQLFGQVAESTRNQQRFLANAAHQLRTPLAGLRAHAEFALKQSLPGSAERAELEQIHRATIRTARLANQLLALARAEPGGYLAELRSPVSLRSVVEESADEWVHRALEKEIDLGFELEDTSVPGDAMLLREAFANLIHNALEYTNAGGRITVRAVRRDGRALLEVEDDGPGIPAAERERVLERFYRVPGTSGTGSGLGLSIVSEIAAAHGARMEIGPGESGQGCRVALTFPHG
jgi:two-component system sensor histidine kinase TctE